MTTTTERKLTVKQERVMRLLSEGLKPPAIAKRMKISRAGVYGHMRAMRKAGHVLPGEAISSNGTAEVTSSNTGTKATAASNGNSPEQTLRDAVASCDEQMAASEQLMRELEEQLEKIRSSHETANAERNRYSRALEALAV